MHEMSSWIFENASRIDEETIKQISFELRAIRLAEGECIVCNSKKVANGCFENIVKILEKYKSDKEVINEFIKMFGQ
jgi:hypothetical protein